MSYELKDLQKYSDDVCNAFLTMGVINEGTKEYIKRLCNESDESIITNTWVGTVFFIVACSILIFADGGITSLSSAIPIFVLSFYFFVRSYIERRLLCRYELILFMSYQQKELTQKFKNIYT